jgi:glutamine amidotransferase-like uncharacterized protein
MTRIGIYNGAGAARTDVLLLKRAFSEALQDFGTTVHLLSHDDLNEKNGAWQKKTDVLVIGGGAYGEMKAVLRPGSLRAIYDYAQENITIGICMGGYGLSSSTLFTGEKIHKTSDGISAYSGHAVGSLPITPVLYNGNSNSARIITLRHEIHDLTFPSLYWGGPSFKLVDQIDGDVTPLVTLNVPYSAEPLIMGLRVNHNAGGRTILLGYHSEAMRPSDLTGWLERFKSNNDDMDRMRIEIAAHPIGKYYLGFSALLDDAGLVPDHSFLRSILKPSPSKDIVSPWGEMAL